MQVDNFVTSYVKGLREKLESANKALCTGNGINDIADYRHLLGRAIAFQECINHLEHVYSQFYHTTTLVSWRENDGFGAAFKG